MEDIFQYFARFEILLSRQISKTKSTKQLDFYFY